MSQLLGRIFHAGSWPGRSLRSSLRDKGDGHRCGGRDVSSPCLLAAAPGRLPGMPAPRLSLPGQGVHLPGEPGGPGSPGHPCQHHRTVSRERERWGAAALWLALQTSCCLASHRSGLQGASWETSCQLFAEHSPSSDAHLITLEAPLRFSDRAQCKISVKKGFCTL